MGILIDGGIALEGEADIQSSKNAALPMLAGALLARGTTALVHCPRISDVYHMIELMEELGCRIWWESDTLYVNTEQLVSCEITKGAASKMRSSVTFLGSLIGRCAEAEIPYPGGCVIGRRPIDLHIKGLECLGVHFELDQDGIHAQAHGLHGAEIALSYPSVGATENLMLAAALADGVTHITGCALEPEVVELGHFLNAMGARIRWEKDNTVVIEGTDVLNPVEYEVPRDRIVAGTYLLAVAATRGNATLHGVPWEQLGALNEVLVRMGAVLEQSGDVVNIRAEHAGHAAGAVRTGPYPGFPTDLQPQLVTALTVADGRSGIIETVFESRFAVLQELRKMNAGVRLEDGAILIDGGSRLRGAHVQAGDLRGGAALVTAGLMAEGTTRIDGCEYLERGYADIVADMARLGGRIRKV